MTTRRAKRTLSRRDTQLRTAIIVVGVLIFVLAAGFVALRITSTPTLNRVPRPGHRSAADLQPEQGKDICPQFPARTGKETQPPPMVIREDRDYAAWITLKYGVIVADLYANVAPKTVNNYMFLACSKFYDGLTFHRALPGFMVEGGDPKGDGTGGPGYTIPDEYALTGMKFDREGLVGISLPSGPNSAGSQFFIMFGSQSKFDGRYTIFGEVVSGIDVASGITPRIPELHPPPGDEIVSIVVREIGP